jgi:hypothetical protein
MCVAEDSTNIFTGAASATNGRAMWCVFRVAINFVLILVIRCDEEMCALILLRTTSIGKANRARVAYV